MADPKDNKPEARTIPADHREIEAIVGPYRGQRLTMTNADADGAVNDHWAIDPYKGIDPNAQHTEGEPLSEEERTHALEAAKTWAAAQLAASQGETPPPPPPEGETEAQRGRREQQEQRERDMKPDPKPGGYTTRGR